MPARAHLESLEHPISFTNFSTVGLDDLKGLVQLKPFHGLAVEFLVGLQAPPVISLPQL